MGWGGARRARVVRKDPYPTTFVHSTHISLSHANRMVEGIFRATMNTTLIQAIRRQPVAQTPVWFMRQAGRYLPEYRALRAKAGSFMTLSKTPELACEITLQPLKRFPLDAAILFSDILTIPDAMGLGLNFQEGEGPVFQYAVRSRQEVAKLPIPQPEEDLHYVLDAIRLIQRELAGKVPLIGFCGSPWTIAAYMVEGRGRSHFPLIQQMLQQDPALLHQLLDKLKTAITLHLQAQIQAGVNVIMIFDTWGGLLSTQHYREFSLRYNELIFSALASHIPKILFTKQGGQWIEDIASSGCDVIGLDWEINLNDARRKLHDRVALQGNLNPQFLYESETVIEQEIARILQSYGHGSGHIFNLGHGIPQDVQPEKIAFVVDTVHRLSCAYHGDNF